MPPYRCSDTLDAYTDTLYVAASYSISMTMSSYPTYLLMLNKCTLTPYMLQRRILSRRRASRSHRSSIYSATLHVFRCSICVYWLTPYMLQRRILSPRRASRSHCRSMSNLRSTSGKGHVTHVWMSPHRNESTRRIHVSLIGMRHVKA